MRNFSKINKSTSCLTSIFQKTSIHFLKHLDCNALLGKCSAAIFSVIVDSHLKGRKGADSPRGGGGALVSYQGADQTLFIFCHCFPL